MSEPKITKPAGLSVGVVFALVIATGVMCSCTSKSSSSVSSTSETATSTARVPQNPQQKTSAPQASPADGTRGTAGTGPNDAATLAQIDAEFKANLNAANQAINGTSASATPSADTTPARVGAAASAPTSTPAASFLFGDWKLLPNQTPGCPQKLNFTATTSTTIADGVVGKFPSVYAPYPKWINVFSNGNLSNYRQYNILGQDDISNTSCTKYSCSTCAFHRN